MTAIATGSSAWRKRTAAGNSRLELRLATVADARGIRLLLTIGKGRKEIDQLRIAAFGDEPRPEVASTPATRLANPVQERGFEIGKGDGAIARRSSVL